MKRLALLLCTPLLIFAMTLPASAQSPQFRDPKAVLNDSTLEVTFTEVGLEPSQVVSYNVFVDLTIVHVCANRGGAVPSASNKTTVNEFGAGSGADVFADELGRIAVSETFGPRAARSPDCPSGQTQEVASVTYSNIIIRDLTNNIETTLPGPLTSGCLLPDVRGAC